MKLSNLSTIKILALFLALLAVLLLCSCNDGDTNETEPPAVETDTPTDEAPKYTDGKLRIFADGEYQCAIVRPEHATKRELELYVNLRNIFKEVTGVMPPIATDFIAYNESYDSEKFEILVGTTNHAEASELYSKLSYNDFRAELVNKKYVLAFHDMNTANNALEKFRTLLTQNFKNGELILDESWNYSHSENEILEAIPVYEGGDFTDVYEGAYGMQTVQISSTDENEYNAYLTKLATEGYSLYTDNSIGDNLFATFQSDKYVVTTMYLDAISEVRITMEYAGTYDLPALEAENVYTDAGIEATITQIGLEESNDAQNGMSYIIKLADGSFMIFDGGRAPGTDQFVEIIRSLADDPDNITVAAWVITHAHSDHIGMLYSLLINTKYIDMFNIEQIIWSQVSDAQLANMGSGSLDYIDNRFSKLTDTRIVIAHPGQVFYIRNATYTVFSTIEMVEPIVLANLNDTCVVGRLEIDGRSLFFPGDSHPTETEMLNSVYKDLMKSDVVQVVHHGYQGGNSEFYAYVDPLTVLWPLGEKNYYTAESPNTPMKDWAYSAWLFTEDSNVQTIYVAGSEVITLTIKDLPSHSATK